MGSEGISVPINSSHKHRDDHRRVVKTRVTSLRTLTDRDIYSIKLRWSRNDLCVSEATDSVIVKENVNHRQSVWLITRQRDICQDQREKKSMQNNKFQGKCVLMQNWECNNWTHVAVVVSNLGVLQQANTLGHFYHTFQWLWLPSDSFSQRCFTKSCDNPLCFLSVWAQPIPSSTLLRRFI